jgi:uncharacterized protein (TIGR02271 family)
LKHFIHFTEETLMNNTVVAIFDEYGQAQQAMNALFNEGFTHSHVKLSPAEESPQLREQFLRSQQSSTAESGWSIGDFFRSMFGTDQHGDDAGAYSEAVRRGSYMLSVDAADEDEAEHAADIMQRYNAIDLDQRAAHWRSTGWTGYQSDAPLYTADQIQQERAGYTTTTTIASTAASPASAGGTAQSSVTGQSIPVVEEQLQVGKRAVQRGGVRIYRHVTETPVQESVQLREEHVSVERTPVNQPASTADIDAFKEGTIEVRETAEEPVVAKTARVVEEVSIGKEVTERTETISDTVRRADVEVEQLGSAGGGVTAGTTLSDDAFRQHWQSAYGTSGGKYEDYAQAYRYGANLAGNKQYQGYRWDELEPQVRTDWESTHAGSPWERTKQAVRYGWERMTGK